MKNVLACVAIGFAFLLIISCSGGGAALEDPFNMICPIGMIGLFVLMPITSHTISHLQIILAPGVNIVAGVVLMNIKEDKIGMSL